MKRLPAKCLTIKSNHLCNFLCIASVDSLSPCSSLSSSACSLWIIHHNKHVVSLLGIDELRTDIETKLEPICDNLKVAIWNTIIYHIRGTWIQPYVTHPEETEWKYTSNDMCNTRSNRNQLVSNVRPPGCCRWCALDFLFLSLSFLICWPSYFLCLHTQLSFTLCCTNNTEQLE